MNTLPHSSAWVAHAPDRSTACAFPMKSSPVKAVAAENAEQYARLQAAAEAEKRKLIERLSKPSGLTEEEKVELASTVIRRAVRNGLTEVQVYRFPHTLCTDNGRAINQQEPGWEKTLMGIAQEIYQLWFDHLKPRGYRIRFQILDF